MSRGQAVIGLHMPKDTNNLGSVLRIAGCYGVRGVFYTGQRYRHSSTDTQRYAKHNLLVQAANLRDVIPHGAVPVAVEFMPDRAQNLIHYEHPLNAFYIFGPEDSSLGAPILNWCRDVIYVPTVYCLNQAICAGAVLYDRQAKIERRASAGRELCMTG